MYKKIPAILISNISASTAFKLTSSENYSFVNSENKRKDEASLDFSFIFLLDGSANPSESTKCNVYVFFGVRLEQTVLEFECEDEPFFKKLGFFDDDSAYKKENWTSSFKIFNFKDAAKLRFFQTLTFDLIPTNPSRIIAFYNKRYRATVAFNTNLCTIPTQ